MLMLGMMTLMPSFCYADRHVDSLVMNRIWNYRRNYTQSVSGEEQNVYLRYTFDVARRNPTLFLVPTMYVIAEGDRQFISESYCKLRFRDFGDYDLQRQVVSGTIPRQNTAMPPILEMFTPDLYAMTLYPGRLLSPFHQANRNYYNYQLVPADGDIAMMHFTPRYKNTQLINGYAVVNTRTGRLQSVKFDGEYDMIKFNMNVLMNLHETHTPLPERCTIDARFKFLGNRINANLAAVFNCPTSLPDSVNKLKDRALMEELRPIPLTAADERIYKADDDREQRRAEQRALEEKERTDSVHDSSNWLKEVVWDYIGYNLIKTHRAKTGGFSMKMSPLLSPVQLGFRPGRGLSYKLKLGLQYNWNAHRYLSLNTRFGYNFKLNQIFYTIPLRMTYNPKRNGYAEIVWGNGNHISNGILSDDFEAVMGDSIGMPDFKDQYIQAINNIVAFDWLEIKGGVVFHRRTSLDKKLMSQAGMPTEFRSFAPTLTLQLAPWHNGPVLTANYERGLKSVFESNLDYERWEFDASYIDYRESMHIINLRGGFGFYTKRNSNYFVDYENFRDNNLPNGWEDDWTGQFQLLRSAWYNASRYYARIHASYEMPMMIGHRLPIFGRAIEKERVYFSALSIQHTRPYFELGYGFTNRYFSTAFFTSFLGIQPQRFGCEFTVDIFRKW